MAKPVMARLIYRVGDGTEPPLHVSVAARGETEQFEITRADDLSYTLANVLLKLGEKLRGRFRCGTPIHVGDVAGWLATR